MNEKTLPTIFESDTSNLIKEKETPQSSFLSFFKGGKVILIVLVAVILFELVVGFRILQTPIPKLKLLEPVSGGKIVLAADKQDVPVGDTLSVNIRVSTGGYMTDGTDLVISYNPALLEAVESSLFTSGDIYTEYPIVTNDVKTGTIRISGISASDGEGFVGTGNFGTLLFKTKKNGNTTVTVVFKKGLTTDSNIIETKTNTDVLSGVYNLDLAIGSRNLNQQNISQLGSCEGFSQICRDSNGKQGVQLCQGGKWKDNACVWDPQLTISCGTCEINQ